MDRSEAYLLLTEEMRLLSQKSPDHLDRLRNSTVEIDRLGAGGVLYKIELTVEHVAGVRFAVVGKIHDNSSYEFSLLGERLEFEAGAKI